MGDQAPLHKRLYLYIDTARCLSLYLFQGKGVASIFEALSSAAKLLPVSAGS